MKDGSGRCDPPSLCLTQNVLGKLNDLEVRTDPIANSQQERLDAI